jgi:hypothetical protein
MRDEVKGDEMAEACSTYGKSENWIVILKVCKEERGDLGVLEPDDSVIMKLVLGMLRLRTAMM